MPDTAKTGLGTQPRYRCKTTACRKAGNILEGLTFQSTTCAKTESNVMLYRRLLTLGVGTRTIETKAQGMILDRDNAAGAKKNLTDVCKKMYEGGGSGRCRRDPEVTRDILRIKLCQARKLERGARMDLRARWRDIMSGPETQVWKEEITREVQKERDIVRHKLKIAQEKKVDWLIKVARDCSKHRVCTAWKNREEGEEKFKDKMMMMKSTPGEEDKGEGACKGEEGDNRNDNKSDVKCEPEKEMMDAIMRNVTYREDEMRRDKVEKKKLEKLEKLKNVEKLEKLEVEKEGESGSNCSSKKNENAAEDVNVENANVEDVNDNEDIEVIEVH